MKFKKVISYEWFADHGGEIKEAHVQALVETADDVIYEMLKNGYTEGSLQDNIFMHDDDIENGQEGISYFGYWTIKQ